MMLYFELCRLRNTNGKALDMSPGSPLRRLAQALDQLDVRVEGVDVFIDGEKIVIRPDTKTTLEYRLKRLVGRGKRWLKIGSPSSWTMPRRQTPPPMADSGLGVRRK